MNFAAGTFADGCVALDLEVGKRDERIDKLGAVRADTGQSLHLSCGNLAKALTELDDFADGATCLLGHNLIRFDVPHLQAANPNLRLLRLPRVDTLWLNPLAFPRNPYHHLIKHYQDAQLKRGRINDPELDARLALQVLGEQRKALREASPDLLSSWHWLTGVGADGTGFEAFFSDLRLAPRPAESQARAAVSRQLEGMGCTIQGREVLENTNRHGWSLAYALAWLSVSGGNSVMPPWVRHEFPEAGDLVRRLRDTPCRDSACDWCRDRHDAKKELARWFNYRTFRAKPQDDAGRPMQQSIVEAAMAGEHVLGILPTGVGKSICYQVPALSRYHKTGAMTVVISPLAALMADQVMGLEKRGIGCCVTINGLLSMPERADALDRVRLGDAGILIVAPEQLRSRTVRRAIEQREIGAWVLDEAHCLSKWGHDFRPDYRYVAKFIRQHAPAASVLCLTATAKPDVKEDIVAHFRDKLGVELKVFDGGAQRDNLGFVVVTTTSSKKFSDVHNVLMADLPPNASGGAIIYCAARKRTEDVAAFLRDKEIAADPFHAGLSPEVKKNTQQRFINGDLRVIVATNAFGMGIDKPDVRLVIHADVPGSLENYLQEAGRAGRDQKTARCVLLYTPDDVERQFGLAARHRLTRREIQGILKALRNLDRRDRNKRMNGEVIATAGEILSEEREGAFEQNSATDDTRVRTAISWLEDAGLLSREDNRVQVFPSSLRVSSAEEVRAKLAKTPIRQDYRNQLFDVAEMLLDADPDEGISTDELMAVSGLESEGVRAALYDLERLGIANNDTALTAYVHVGVPRSSEKRFKETAELEQAFINDLREAAPDMSQNDTYPLHLRVATQKLKDAGHEHALPERLRRLLHSLKADGREEEGRAGLGLREVDRETVFVTLQREWESLSKTAERRRIGAQAALRHLLNSVPPGRRGMDLLAETTLGKLLDAIRSDLVVTNDVKKPDRLLHRALMWLHEQEVIRLNKGLAVFRPAMTIRLSQDKRGFVNADFNPLKLHYDDQVRQIHVMAEYANRGLQRMAEALRLAMDYFTLKQKDFLRRWLPKEDCLLQTTPESWRRIVEGLNNPHQRRIVADDQEQTNVLVLAGPGSGKTRVLVHRIAYLVRVRREKPGGIIALAYNRHAAADIRRRLTDLIGDDGRGVTVLTCHGLAMRLIGASFSGRAETLEDDRFEEVLRQAADLLRGQGLPPEEIDEHRARLLAGFRWILVDEYQDVGSEQYELISALAGRTLADPDEKLHLFAVGDDDQNIYSFNGASVEFIRRFEQDYQAESAFLTENYRSTAHVIAAANAVIEGAKKRMKSSRSIRINDGRRQEPAGGAWNERDPVAHGRVQIVPSGPDPISQAQATLAELLRLAKLASDWDWSNCAVIAREWKYLEPLCACCEAQDVPVQMSNEEFRGHWHLRETQALLAWLARQASRTLTSEQLHAWVDAQSPGPWIDLLREASDEYDLDTRGAEAPTAHFIEWLAEWSRDVRRRQRGLLLLSAHRAKGLEFDHVVVLDGGWDKVGKNEDRDAPRRLYYVAMTRARQTLALMRFNGPHRLQDSLLGSPAVLRRAPVALPPGTPAMATVRRQLGLQDVFLGFAGYQSKNHRVHTAIADLVPGAPLTLHEAGGSWKLLDRQGTQVGQLAKKFSPPTGMRCRSASVLAVATWNREISGPEYRERLACDAWEVVVPELVFEPKETKKMGEN